jgi:hypothetical protein
MDKRKERNQRIRLALEKYLGMESVSQFNKQLARHILGEMDRIESAKPNTTMAGLTRVGDTIRVFVHEPTIAPLGKTPYVVLAIHPVLNHCASAASFG